MEHFRVTHPFHPLHGRELERVAHPHGRSTECVHFRDEAGGLRRLPKAWTDLCPADDFTVAAQGRARFRPDDLVALAELIDALRAG